MAEIVLFHHIQGRTPGVLAYADALRDHGHQVHVPDLFDGRTFDSIAQGVDFLRQLGFDRMRQLGVEAVADLPEELVYAGFSMGAMPAQQLLQTRPGALAGLFYHAFADPSVFGEWPAGVPVQVHAMDADPEFVNAGDLDAAQSMADGHPELALYLYPGNDHLFTDRSLPDHDEEAAALALSRSLVLLDSLDGCF